MKRFLTLSLIFLCSLSALAQSGSLSNSGIFLRVNDSTTYRNAATGKHALGYGDIYWNNQATTPHFDVWNGSSYDHVFVFGGGSPGGGTALGQKTETGTTYTVTDADNNYVIHFSNASGVTVTMPNTVSDDTYVTFIRDEGAGVVTFTEGGTSVFHTLGDEVTIDEEKAWTSWIKDGATDWYAAGGLGPTGGGGGAWGTIPGTLSDQTDLQTALDAKASLASPALTGTPTAPTAANGTDNTQIATTAFVADNSFPRLPSDIYLSGASYQATPEMTLGVGSKNFEIMNIGNTGITDNIGNATMGFVGINGRPILIRNMEFDEVNLKWLTPDKSASAYGSTCFEAGGEAAILHATPPGVNFSDVPHEIFLASANGTDGPNTDQRQTSGYYNQFKAPIFARYATDAYVPTTTANLWNQVSGADPLLWLSSIDAKGTDNEFARLEMNDASTAYPAMYFAKSRGTPGTKTVITTNDVTGRIGFKAYDGDEYHTTATIEGLVRGTMANNSVAQDIRIATSATNTASLATRLEIKYNGPVNVTNTYLRSNWGGDDFNHPKLHWCRLRSRP